MKTTTTAVKTTITVTISGQEFALSLDEAKKLKAQLEGAIPEKEFKWPSPLPEKIVERPVYIPVPSPRADRWILEREFERAMPKTQPFPPLEISCLGTGFPERNKCLTRR